MKINFFLSFFLVLMTPTSFGQELNIFNIKHKIYDKIVEDWNAEMAENQEYYVWIDAKSAQFEEVSLDEFGVKLQRPYEVIEDSYCHDKINILCHTKIEIEMLEIPIIYHKGNDLLYPQYFMIHQPLDSWYGLIYHLNLKKYLKNYDEDFLIKIPFKKLSVKNNQEVNEYYLYTFNLNSQFDITNMTKIKF